MLQTKMAEQNLKEDVVRINSKNYSWPYSQPRIVNIVKATSRMGIFFGILSSIAISNDLYPQSGLLFIDLCMILSFLVMRLGVIPSIRRGQIHEIPSESRMFNKLMLIILCSIIYSGIIRFVVTAGLCLYNSSFNFKIATNIMMETITTNLNPITILIGAIVIVAPSLLLIYPKDVNIRAYHNHIKSVASYPDPIPEINYADPTPVYDCGYMRPPNFSYGTLDSANSNTNDGSNYSYPQNRLMTHHSTSNTKISTNNPKPVVATQPTTKPTPKVTTTSAPKANTSIWDTTSGIRKPRNKKK